VTSTASVPPGQAVFETQTPAKWVLTGEHSVLRGAAAIALPHPELHLKLSFEPGGASLEITPREAAEVIRETLASLPLSREPQGKLEIQSSIPWGAGLGSSAALCVALTRWLSGPLHLPRGEWQDFATRLENRFHGKSSGMDVAVILAGQPVRFVRGQKPVPLEVRRLPHFTFHDTGLRASTCECVARVERYVRDHAKEAGALDELMGQASRSAEAGLKLYDSGEQDAGLEQVAKAMSGSWQCFEAWGLVPPAARDLQQSLLSQGALAAKLTGAGGGGMVVALWSSRSSGVGPK
jgi:mevalonate kinase